MKVFSLVVLFFVFVATPAFAQEPAQEKLVSFELANATLQDFLQAMYSGCQINWVPDKDVRLDQKINVRVAERPCIEILGSVLRSVGLGYELSGGIYRIAPASRLQSEAQARQWEQASQAKNAPPAPVKPQAPAPNPPQIPNAVSLVSHMANAPVTILAPQYLDEERGYGAFGGGYIMLGTGYRYGGRSLGNLREIRQAGPSFQNALKGKLESLNANVIQGVTGSDEKESRNLNRELGVGKNAGTAVQETADFAVQADYAFAVSKQSLKYWDCNQPRNIAGRVLGRDAGKVAELGCIVKAASQKVDMKAVLYLSVVGANRQIVYTEKAVRDFRVSQSQFKEILGIGIASVEEVHGNEIAEGLVADVLR